MLSKEAKSKLVKALFKKLESGKKGASELLYGKKPASAYRASVGGAGKGAIIGTAIDSLLAGTGAVSNPALFKSIGAPLGGLAGRLKASKNLARYEARKANVNRAIAGGGLAGLGLMALKKSQPEE